ncbi:uncharacterized protein I303_107001 [Kwoniella dejecticola CBS 10117]|uniref:Uncharacterized protein n=1 Tax=Kwoniella dejecticola CBS 10117 TaxID=1296121 RepID=A0A1A5ZYG4_9TREE|nr:uncharacterized protein I303_06402 [Kwoniella dejecticola CBS 10117]OBR82845.1 hypothetical protein I303_06402 [Kwoniella dejecticola CBS 10117]
MTTTRSDLPRVGSPSFTPLLIRYLLSHPALHGWSINPSLFSILLLALITRKGGVVIDVSPRDVTTSVNVVQSMVESIFGIRTHTLALYDDSTLDDLSQSLSRSVSISDGASNTLACRALHVSASEGQNGKADGAEKLEVLIVTGLEHANSPVKIKLCDILTKKRLQIRPAMGGGGDHTETRVEDLIVGEIVEVEYDPLVIWIREEGSEVPSWVIDHLILGCQLDSLNIELPPSELEEDQTGIIPSSYISTLKSLLPYVHIHAPLQIHISNLLSAVSSHPSLRTSLTGKAVRAFPELIRAHRLLSGDFKVPQAFLNPAGSGHEVEKEKEKKGLGGGIGGVDTWNQLAGEQPTLGSFAKNATAAAAAAEEAGAGGRGEGGRGDEEGDIEDPYCAPSNVQGVWKVFAAHRCKLRTEREEVMYLIKGSAGSAFASEGGSGRGVRGDKLENADRNVREKRRGVDTILEEITRTV